MARRTDQNAAADRQGTDDTANTDTDASDRQSTASAGRSQSQDPTVNKTDKPKVDPGDSGASVNTPGDQDTDATTQAVQDAVDAETQQGFRGQKVDPTPNENYTLGGQAQGLPVPENDRDTFTPVAQPVLRPTNAGEIVEDQR